MAWLGALAVLVLPVLAGVASGALVRLVITRPGPRKAFLAVKALAVVAAPIVFASYLPFSLYDLVLIAVLYGAALWLRGAPQHYAAPAASLLLLASATTVIGLALLELTARFLPNAPPTDNRPVNELHFYFPPENREFQCRMVYPEVFGYRNVSRHLVYPGDGERVPGKRRYLHIGDSMVDAGDVPLDAAFTSVISAARPSEEHVNVSCGGVGPDAEYLAVTKWVPKLTPDEVFVYVFLGNDIADMDKPYGCCNYGPLLQEQRRPDGSVSMSPGCPTPSFRQPLAMRVEEGPAPYPLRVFGSRSQLARRLARLFEGATRPRKVWRYTDQVGTAAQMEKFHETLYSLRDYLLARKVPLTIVLLPPRWTLEQHNPPGDPFVPQHQTVLRLLREGNIRYLDSWDMLQRAVDDNHSHADVFNSSGPGNPHFGVTGHKMMADWLIQNALLPSSPNH